MRITLGHQALRSFDAEIMNGLPRSANDWHIIFKKDLFKSIMMKIGRFFTNMMNIDPAFYAYALFIVIFVAMLTLLLVIKTLQNNDFPFPTLRTYYFYFTSGIVGFLVLAAKDGAGLTLDLFVNIVVYILSSLFLLLAVAPFSSQSSLKKTVVAIHLVLMCGSFLVFKLEYQILFLSLYIVVTYSVITYFALRAASHEINIGYLIIGLTTLAMVAVGVLQIYLQLYVQKITYVYYLSVVASATGFLLVGIGVLALILVRQSQQLTRLATQDPLTGLLNRRGMENALRLSIAAAKRFDRHISIIAMDIDFFKKINDIHGHDAGDAVLMNIAKILSSTARKSDLCCRIGGEEFLLVLPDADSEGVMAAAKRVHRSVENLLIQREDYTIKVTCSIGVATRKGEINLESLLKEGDEALYLAKKNGRNKICVVSGAT